MPFGEVMVVSALVDYSVNATSFLVSRANELRDTMVAIWNHVPPLPSREVCSPSRGRTAPLFVPVKGT